MRSTMSAKMTTCSNASEIQGFYDASIVLYFSQLHLSGDLEPNYNALK